MLCLDDMLLTVILPLCVTLRAHNALPCSPAHRVGAADGGGMALSGSPYR